MLVISNIIRIFEYKLYIMQRTKFIKTITINDYKYGGNDVQFSVFTTVYIPLTLFFCLICIMLQSIELLRMRTYS